MKFRILLLSFILLAVILPMVSCNSGGEVAAKIDGEVITVGELNQFYYTQNKMLTNLKTNEEIDKLASDPAYARHPYLNKASFLDQLISQKLLYKKAFEDKSIDQEELKTMVEMTKVQTVSQYYLGQKLKDRITVTDKEVNDYYAKNRKRFAGRTANDATQMIKQQIFQYKSRKEANQYIMELMAESKVNKEGFAEYMKKTAKTSTEVKKEEPKKEEK